MFGDLDWPLNASRGLSSIAEFLVFASETSHPSKNLIRILQQLELSAEFIKFPVTQWQNFRLKIPVASSSSGWPPKPNQLLLVTHPSHSEKSHQNSSTTIWVIMLIWVLQKKTKSFSFGVEPPCIRVKTEPTSTFLLTDRTAVHTKANIRSSAGVISRFDADARE